MARGGRVRLETSGRAQLHSTQAAAAATAAAAALRVFPANAKCQCLVENCCRERQWALGLRCKCRAGWQIAGKDAGSQMAGGVQEREGGERGVVRQDEDGASTAMRKSMDTVE